ncbi:hypothetical protein PIB30_042667 [Stylosanthes scabra]|uniref:Uncharacterized protein n=1 Tax=Stylosanthes scabra TaxID=79078 RepID=A0ABU6TFI6_9FABA|nr:hypothetical protein [Stylosanthes scabra]
MGRGRQELRVAANPTNEWQSRNFAVWSVSDQTFSEGVRVCTQNIIYSTNVCSCPFIIVLRNTQFTLYGRSQKITEPTIFVETILYSNFYYLIRSGALAGGTPGVRKDFEHQELIDIFNGLKLKVGELEGKAYLGQLQISSSFKLSRLSVKPNNECRR